MKLLCVKYSSPLSVILFEDIYNICKLLNAYVYAITLQPYGPNWLLSILKNL